MQEKRKNRRFVLEAELSMERIDGTKKKFVPITVTDVSKTGMGFMCDEILEMNSVYKIKLKIWTGDTIDTLVNIIRFDNSGDDYVYGCIFVGMPDNDASKISIYEMFEKANEQEIQL